MINFPIFIEGLLMPLLGLGVLVIYERSKRKKRKFHVPSTHPTTYLSDWKFTQTNCNSYGFATCRDHFYWWS